MVRFIDLTAAPKIGVHYNIFKYTFKKNTE